MPEKAQAARNFCVFSKNGDGIAPAADGASGYEPMVWTAADTLAKGDEGGVTASAKIIKALKDAKCQVMEPKDDEFVSEVQQAYRKGEKAYYVKAFRGSKDGKFLLPLS